MTDRQGTRVKFGPLEWLALGALLLGHVVTAGVFASNMQTKVGVISNDVDHLHEEMKRIRTVIEKMRDM